MAIFEDYDAPSTAITRTATAHAAAYDAFWLGKTPHDHRVTFNQVCQLIAWRARLEKKEPLGQGDKLNLAKLLTNGGNET